MRIERKWIVKTLKSLDVSLNPTLFDIPEICLELAEQVPATARIDPFNPPFALITQVFRL